MSITTPSLITTCRTNRGNHFYIIYTLAEDIGNTGRYLSASSKLCMLRGSALLGSSPLLSFFQFFFPALLGSSPLFIFKISHRPKMSPVIHVVVVDPTPPTCCQQIPAPKSCGSQQSLPSGGKERLHFVGIRPEVQARKGGW